MKKKESSGLNLTARSEESFITWRGLQIRMTQSYIWVTLGAVLLFQIVSGATTARPSNAADLHILWLELNGLAFLVVIVLGALFGFISTYGLISRLRAMTAATTRFAAGQYERRLKVYTKDELGQLETHLNRMAEQLVGYLAQQKLLVAQNARLEERARLARDLHDSVKQQVFALAVQIELAHTLLEKDREAAREHLGEADELSYHIQQELSALIHALRPADLQIKGLPRALEDYLTTWSRQNKIAAEVDLPETCCLPFPIEEVLWRVAQESLSNVARHSRASRVRIKLKLAGQQVSLSISDNGQGFEVSGNQGAGLGLRSISERVERIGGTTLIQSAHGQGTSMLIRCSISPVAESTAKGQVATT
ncbi:sensor histidine kinase [Ktedonosporobacter rubrisoli]|uniref:Oxygen sensor histidine kinase NreB n=1 Tax=Ktedonosporobacter rubrisoli TaxID=2509675 RepID=A0A4P6JHZ5_KTERU|nr:sensor histidine kinase [Ktedonosporobacter rubrisoli]QBD74667.1 sensor histidine kinase [Ktedonosporobacter rubrisoli]